MANQNGLFLVNTSKVMREIWLNNGISRVDISKSLHMDKSTVTKIVKKLLAYEIIYTMKEGKSNPAGGRKPVPLGINVDFGCALGIEIQTDCYSAVITTLKGEKLSSLTGNLRLKEQSISDLFLEILRKLKPATEKFKLLGIVVGFSGIINSKEGIIIKSHPLQIFDKFKFCQEVQKNISIPVFIENDANCCCWGEIITKKAKIPQNMIYILGEFREVDFNKKPIHGIGFGFGIVIDGKVYYGNEFSAGEFKSIFKSNDSACQFSLLDEEINDIQKKPENLIQILRELSKNISLIINFINIEEIVIGGEIINYFDSFKLILTQEIYKNWSYTNQMKYKIKKATDNDVAFGASAMFLEKLFGIPEIDDRLDKEDLRGIKLLEKVISKVF